MFKLTSGTIVLIYLVSIFQKNVSACEIPIEVRGVKAYCWSSSTLVGDKIQQMEKKMEEMASGYREPKEPQKCEYYYCIFKQMDLLNPNYDVPCQERLTNWIQKNVVNQQAPVLLDRVNKCSDELKNSKFASDPYEFRAENVGVPDGSKIKSSRSQMQSSCEVSAEYMKCLGFVETSQQCPVFTYP